MNLDQTFCDSEYCLIKKQCKRHLSNFKEKEVEEIRNNVVSFVVPECYIEEGEPPCFLEK